MIRNRQFVSNLRALVIKNMLFSKNILLKYINKNDNDAIFFLYLRNIIYTQLKIGVNSIGSDNLRFKKV